MDCPQRTVIKVIGLGGGGSNAINRMLDSELEDVQFIAANTDAQALSQSRAPGRLLLGPNTTKGLGAGGRPERGEAAAEESWEAIKDMLRDTDMVFLTAGMGGGTGTGAIPVVAAIAQSLGILTVAVVSTPFSFEAKQRRRNAEDGLAKLTGHVDTLITIPNDRLLNILPRNTTLEIALRVADEGLRQGVQGIVELISRPGLMNVDFSNIKALMTQAGNALMAIGQGQGENKAIEATRQALKLPLWDIQSLEPANGLLLHFTGGEDLSLYEINQAMEELTQAAPNANVVVGAMIDSSWNGRAQAILIVTGVESRPPQEIIVTTKLQPVAQTRSAPVFQPEITAPKPVTRAPIPLPAQSTDLAEAFFRQAIAEANPVRAAHLTTDGYTGDTNDLDSPAFLRKRRTTVGDFERKNQ